MHMGNRLLDAVIRGFGFSAGKALFDDAVKDVEEATREPTEAERRAAEAEATKRAIAEEKARAVGAKKAEVERRKTEKEIDAELATLKKKLGK